MGRSNSTRRKIQRGGVTVLGDIGLSALALFLAGGSALIFKRYIETYNGEKSVMISPGGNTMIV
jgi:hypothetical protein